MSQPTDKTPKVEADLMAIAIGGGDRRVAIEADVCFVGAGGCGKAVHAEDFTSEAARREQRITGLCQRCQDVIFAPPPDEE